MLARQSLTKHDTNYLVMLQCHCQVRIWKQKWNGIEDSMGALDLKGRSWTAISLVQVWVQNLGECHSPCLPHLSSTVSLVTLLFL